MKSYFHQPSTTPYVYETLPERVKKLAEEAPDKIAMVVYHSKEERYQITRKEIYDKALKFAQVLIRLGIKKGDRVAYCVSNCIDWLAYDVGIMMAGAVSVHLLMGSADVNVTLTDCVMIILDSKERWSAFQSVAEIHPGGKISCAACPSLKVAIAVDKNDQPANVPLASALMAEIGDGVDLTQLPDLDPEDTAFINQTSGTTGTPKKVCHSHFNAINNLSIMGQCFNLTSKDVVYAARPMAYAVGYPRFYIGTGAKYITGDVRFLNQQGNKEFVKDMWRKEGCTFLFLLPQDLKSIRDFGFRVRFIISGGDMVTKEMIKNSLILTEAFSLAYGTTETSFTASKIFTKKNVSEHQQGMIGSAIPSVELKIVNEQDDVVEMGEVGTLCIRSVLITKGYDGIKTFPIKNNYFYTNFCYMEPSGVIIMKGRKSGFIIKNTVNVSVPLIEDIVGSHPDVEQAVVVGIPDPRYGEDICACVRITSGRTLNKEALRVYCEKKMHSKSSIDWITMVPSYFLPFEAFPTLLTKKLDRNKIKNMAIERVKLV